MGHVLAVSSIMVTYQRLRRHPFIRPALQVSMEMRITVAERTCVDGVQYEDVEHSVRAMHARQRVCPW